MNCEFGPEDGESKAQPASALLLAFQVLERSRRREWFRGIGPPALLPPESRRLPQPRFRPRTESARIWPVRSELVRRIRHLRPGGTGSGARQTRTRMRDPRAVPTLLRLV